MWLLTQQHTRPLDDECFCTVSAVWQSCSRARVHTYRLQAHFLPVNEGRGGLNLAITKRSLGCAEVIGIRPTSQDRPPPQSHTGSPTVHIITGMMGGSGEARKCISQFVCSHKVLPVCRSFTWQFYQRNTTYLNLLIII